MGWKFWNNFTMNFERFYCKMNIIFLITITLSYLFYSIVNQNTKLK
jgi:hypothetical protein